MNVLIRIDIGKDSFHDPLYILGITIFFLVDFDVF